MSLAQFYPWQTATAQSWLGDRERFAHAWLIHGPEGIGKLNFCLAAAAALLCSNPHNGLACGQCESCHWLSLGNHMDFRLVLPDALSEQLGFNPESTDKEKNDEIKLSNEIRIEQVRQLEEFMGLTTHQGGLRVVVLGPAEAFNTASANAILKVLEEPNQNTVFLIFTHAIQKLLPTIISRCRRLPLSVPEPALAQQWLKQQGLGDPELWLAAAAGAPLLALQLSESPVEPVSYWLNDFIQAMTQRRMPDLDDFVARLEKVPNRQWIDTLQRLLLDMHLLHYQLAPRFFPGLRDRLQDFSNTVNPVKLAELQQYLKRQQGLSSHPLNAKLFIQATLQRVVLSCLAKN